MAPTGPHLETRRNPAPNLHSGTNVEAMEVIKKIRRDNFSDPCLYAENQEIKSAAENSRRNIQAACEKLSDDLYTKPSHFVVEFIQNADDNQYADGVTPTLEMNLEGDWISIECNEIGFTAANVTAICRIGDSTKRGGGCIGEKGIGFKSIFKVADVVYISSRSFTFKLDSAKEMGIITPEWSERYPVRCGWTSFHAHLSDGTNKDKLAVKLQEVKPSVLLFLRKLRQFKLYIKTSDTKTQSYIMSREDEDSSIITLLDSRSHSSQRYFVVRHQANTFPRERKRKDIERSEVVLAFPVTVGKVPTIERQPVHAFLPLRSYGFSFIIHADFLTSANREDILETPWNAALLLGVVAAFSVAVEQFKKYSTLKFAWLKFLPNIEEPLFQYVQDAIFSNLANSRVLLTSSGKYRLPRECIVATKYYLSSSGEPLLAEKYLPGDINYLSLSYDIASDGQRIRRLGARYMSNADFLLGLKKISRDIRRQPPSWHADVCDSLLWILESEESHRAAIKRLDIIPLSDGSWVSADSDGLIFPSKLVDIPHDIGFLSVSSCIEPGSWPYKLFVKLGAKRVDAQAIADRILNMHAKEGYRGALESLMRHARFLFTHRQCIRLRQPVNLRVIDEQEKMAYVGSVYGKFSDSESEVGIPTILPLPANFLHSSYLRKDDWWVWLRSIGVMTFPRLIKGQLRSEFLNLIPIIDTNTLLIVLRDTWGSWESEICSEAIGRLGKIPVRYQGGGNDTLTLKSCALKRKDIRHLPGLAFLPVAHPDSPSWNFLSRLGVVIQADATLFLQRLIDLYKSNSEDEAAILEVYKQLEARFESYPERIRNAFDEDPLIFVPVDGKVTKQWISIGESVWTKPQSMISKVAIEPSYPSLLKFFRDQLHIGCATPEMLVDELNREAQKSASGPLSKSKRDHIYHLLVDMSRAIDQDSLKTTLLKRLHKTPIFPVVFPSSNAMKLFSADFNFYVPDSSRKLASIFADEVPVLSVPSKYCISQIMPVLESSTFCSRLKFLETSATHIKKVPGGRRILEGAVTEKYVAIIPFIKRLIHSKRASKKSTCIVDKLNTFQVFTVDSIESTFILDVFVRTHQEELTVEEDDTHLSVLLRNKIAPNSHRDLLICHQLAAMLDLDPLPLYMFVTQPRETCEELLRIQGVPELSRHVRDSHPWFGGADSGTTVLAGRTSTAAKLIVNGATDLNHSETEGDLQCQRPKEQLRMSQNPASRRSAPEDAPPTNIHLGVNRKRLVAQRARDPSVSQLPRITSSPASSSDSESDFDEDGFTESIEAVVKAAEGYTVGSIKTMADDSAGTTASALFEPNSIERADRPDAVPRQKSGEGKNAKISKHQKQTGMLGEFFVYAFLCKQLPDFGKHNWTNEMRGKYPGLEPFSGASLADFKYHDTQGVLTHMIFGEKQKMDWKDKWPLYHLEVKTTAGTEKEPFHISKKQCGYAFDLTRRSDMVPRQVYVIVRVSGVHSACPSLAMYDDPHHRLYTGALRLASSVAVST